MKVIQSTQNEFIKNIDKLKEKKVRNNKKQFIVEGYHLIEEAYKHHQLVSIFSTKEDDFKKYPNVDHYLVNEQIIKKISTTVNPQSIIGVVDMPVFDSIDLNKNQVKILLLDSINDPGNLGSIIRTAAALGYDGVYMSQDTVDIYNEKTLRATQGAIFKIPFFYVHLEDIIQILKEHNIKCYGTHLKKSKNLDSIEKTNKFAVCFGNEARGMSDKITDLMDLNIKIEMQNEVESLNVLSASSIVMYYLK